MAELSIPQARVKDISGKILFIVPKGAELLPGHFHYNSDFDKQLLCPCCDAPLQHRSEVPSSGGSSFPGRAAHFALMPNRDHEDDCDVPARIKKGARLLVNPTIGWRIHLNTRRDSEVLNIDFNDASGVYMMHRGRPRLRDPKMLERERYSVKTPNDLLSLIRKGQHERLKDSVVVFGNRLFTWDEFFIKRDKERYSNLNSRLNMKVEEEVPCAVFFQPHETTTISYNSRKKFVRGQLIPIEDDGRNVTKSVRIDLSLRYMWDKGATDRTFYADKTYLATGIAKTDFLYSSAKDGNVDIVKVYIDNKDAVMQMSKTELLARPTAIRANRGPDEATIAQMTLRPLD